MDRLIEVDAQERERGSACRDLVPVARSVCACGASQVREVVRQDALLRAGGYGGTRRVETDICPACFSVRVVAVATERPSR